MRKIMLITAPYCGACKQYFLRVFEPVMAQVKWLGRENVQLERIDGMEHPEVARKYNILTVPAVVVQDDTRKQTFMRDALPNQDELCGLAWIPPLTDKENHPDDYC
jgi:thiol-disulfide isomerase/thioredoxin